MADPVLESFDYPAQPGADWPAIAGAPGGEQPPAGGTEHDVGRAGSVIPRMKLPNVWSWYPTSFFDSFPYTTATFPPYQALSSMGQNRLFAVPFLSPGGRLANMAYFSYGYFSYYGTPSFRLGLYSSTSSSNIYPSQLLWSSTPINFVDSPSSLTIYSQPVNRSLSQGLYWAAFIFAGTTYYYGSGTTMSAYPQTGVLGYATTGGNLSGPCAYFAKDMTYGSLPASFPVFGSAYIAGGGSAFPIMWTQFG